MAIPNLCIVAISLVVSASLCPSLTQGAAVDTSKVQAAANSASSSGDSSDSEPINVVRRYVPRFVGKREHEPVDKFVDASVNQEYDNVAEQAEVDDTVSQFIEYINSMGDKDVESDVEGFEEREMEKENEDDMEDFEDLSYSLDDNDEIESQEVKRYKPMFVGKRQYNPMFVGKRYKPMFVGKRYQPMFVGKRYQPMFVGKRYQPMFVGKRYQPMFVGKRYTPKFVGKRYTPKFVGKRYTPKFVGKRFTPSFVGKRDVSENNNNVEQTKSIRRKRSLSEDSELDKRAWGRYTPLPGLSSYRRFPEQTAFKRFVAPEFIGRRDSLSSILSALDALQYMQQPGRSTTKRFEAPMFIGKRPFTPSFVGKRGPLRPMFVGKRSPWSELNWDALQDYGLDDQGYALSPLSFSSLHQSFAPDFSEFSGLTNEKDSI